jgi:dTMP kinase
MKIISFEGIDGVGKSTIIQEVYNRLKKQNKNVKLYFEPGTTETGIQIRNILKNKTKKDPLTNLLLYASARAELVNNLSNLKNVDYVLIDRYVDSTTAYQHYGNGIETSLIQTLNNTVTKNRKFYPDHTYWITVPNDERIKRLQKGDREIDDIDTNNEYLNKVLNGYREIYNINKYRITEVKNIDKNECVDTIIKDLESRFNNGINF